MNIAPSQNSSKLGVFVRDGMPVVSSRDVAEKFGKKHFHVLRDIENLECSKDFTESNFGFSEYTDPTGRKLPEVLMTRDGFTFLAMGFTGAKAAQFKEAYIAEFNRMEAELRNPDPARALVDYLQSDAKALCKIVGDYGKTIEKLEYTEKRIGVIEKALVNNVGPVQRKNELAKVKGSFGMNEFAKRLSQSGINIGRTRLMTSLRDIGLLGRTGRNYNLPSSRAIAEGYMVMSCGFYEGDDGEKHAGKPTPLVTPKGEDWIKKQLVKSGKIRLVEIYPELKGLPPNDPLVIKYGTQSTEPTLFD